MTRYSRLAILHTNKLQLGILSNSECYHEIKNITQNVSQFPNVSALPEANNM